MTEEPNEPGSTWAGIASVPGEVVRLLKDDKLLLTGVAAACLVALIAATVPSLGLPYALVVAGLAVVVILVRVVVDWRRDRERGWASGDPHSNELRAVGRVRLRNARLEAAGGNRVDGGRVKMKGVVMRAGLDPPAETPPAQPEVGQPQDDA